MQIKQETMSKMQGARKKETHLSIEERRLVLPQLDQPQADFKSCGFFQM